MRISDWSSDVCSSDLLTISLIRVSPVTWRRRRADSGSSNRQDHSDLQAVSGPNATTARYFWARWNWGTKRNRSEEHTSELQSLMRTSYAVFCSKQKMKSTHI